MARAGKFSTSEGEPDIMPARKKARGSKPPPRSAVAKAPRSGENHDHFFFEHMYEGFFRREESDL
jgi:hypothetical protein